MKTSLYLQTQPSLDRFRSRIPKGKHGERRRASECVVALELIPASSIFRRTVQTISSDSLWGSRTRTWLFKAAVLLSPRSPCAANCHDKWQHFWVGPSQLFQQIQTSFMSMITFCSFYTAGKQRAATSSTQSCWVEAHLALCLQAPFETLWTPYKTFHGSWEEIANGAFSSDLYEKHEISKWQTFRLN